MMTEVSSATRQDPSHAHHRSSRPVVCFLGPAASFTHQATRATFPEKHWDLRPVATIKEIFDVVQAGDAAYGVTPFENSTHGPVTFTMDCLADRQGAYGGLSVCGETYLTVHHFLLGRRQQRLEDGGEDLSHIRRAYSHPQAFGQTAAFFAARLRGVETIDVSSTSRAAEMAAADETRQSAAVASEMAAAASGLDVLARCIEDRDDNATRFFVIRKSPSSDPEDGRSGGTAGGGVPEFERARQEKIAADQSAENNSSQGREGEDNEKGARTKSLVSFTVPHRSPGALADVLECFRAGGLNLTSINSLPSLIQPFQYLFFVEFEGSRFDDPDGRVEQVLRDVGRAARTWRWLGSWENQRR